MITVNMYQIGEDVLIRAKVTDIIVENGEIKYKIKTEHSNNDLDHKFTDHQIIPVEHNAKDEKVEEKKDEA